LIKQVDLLVPLHPVLPFGRRKDLIELKEALVSAELTLQLQALHQLVLMPVKVTSFITCRCNNNHSSTKGDFSSLDIKKLVFHFTIGMTVGSIIRDSDPKGY
jgi:hypothetical protein